MSVPYVEILDLALQSSNVTTIWRPTSGQPTNNSYSTDGGVNDGDDVPEFRLKGGVKICASLERTEAVTVCELGEHSDIAVVFELETCD